MGPRSTEGWTSAVASFRSCPTAFLSAYGASDTFVVELLQELRSEKLGEQIKVSMLSLLLEYPTLLCPDAKAGQEAAASLLSFFAQLGSSPRLPSLRCHLLFTTGTVLLATDAFSEDCQTSHEYLTLLFHLASDLNDRHGGPVERPLRVAACECLREVECCHPGLLSQRLETLHSLQQQETSPAHQGYTLLYSLALRNAIFLLARRGQGTLGELLAGSGGLVWGARKELADLPLAALDQLFLLPSSGDLKELKSVVSALLDSSYLLSPAAQSHLLWHLGQAVSVVRTQSPAIFKAQLVRLFGTADLALLHAILQLKSLFTDSLFTPEDEAFLLRRLVGMAQHPALPAPVKLFHLDCLLHFPENRPLGSGNEEGLPVLLTPRTISGLFPGLFQDQGTVLARLNLLCLVCMDSEGPAAEQGMGYLLEHVLALGGLVAGNGGQEASRLFFRAVFLFSRYFGSRTQPMTELTHCLLDLYRQNCALAPNVINLLDEVWAVLEGPSWAGSFAHALQELIVGLPLQEKELSWHLRVLARLAKEKDIPQRSTMQFLRRLIAVDQLGDWRSGQVLLSVCRNLMQLQPLPAPSHLADLLQAVSLCHVDVDVRDRARFYYTLLTNLSDEKLGAVLVPQGPVKARTLSSSIVADSESFVASLTVHPAERAPMRLERVGKSSDVPAALSPEQDVDNYCQWLLEPRPPSQLSLTYQLVHLGPPSPPWDLLLCVVLRFVCSDQHYEPVPELCVPCLSAHHPPRTLTLTLQPRCPYPTRVNIFAVYTTHKGLTYCSQLEPLEVAFPDLFLPLMVPAWPTEKRHHFFGAFWHRLHPDSNEACAESLVCLPVPPQSLGRLVQDNFARYILAEQSGSYEIGMALPPQYHILLQVQSTEDSARVNIRTDNWKLLPSLNNYLLGLVEAS
ncbi:AP-5 complex subunit beta-1 [Eublepharis macularius]|uniref:AP-5 complex subunit beta-1 n=1 Tax=Eublepharis macularius TaxID=481883 RepID=A0AA97JW31_EUBMA|nr:AP-5 complex subunit beta-1 [Eublepharis macularius]XP_054844491.1 AP-5 complex subunit beta-1 [Eublepharis macularius]